MRILLATPLVPPEPGGPSYYSVALRDALEKKGHKVIFKAFKDVRRFPPGVRHLLFFFMLLRAGRGANVVLALDTWSVALPAVCAGAFLRKPVLLRSGGDYLWERYIERTGNRELLSDFYRSNPMPDVDVRARPAPTRLSARERFIYLLLRHLIFRFAACVIFSTVWQRDLLCPAYRLPYARTAVIENTYPKKQKGELPTRKNFVCVWRPTTFKNIATLEEAFVQVKECYPSVELEVYSGIPREEVFRHLRSCYALVIPSLSEVSPNLALEALSFGKPVLLTRDCGLRARLGEAVLWVDPTSTEDMAARMEELLDPGTYATAAKAAQLFSFVRTYDDIAEEFLLLVKKQAPSI